MKKSPELSRTKFRYKKKLMDKNVKPRFFYRRNKFECNKSFAGKVKQGFLLKHVSKVKKQ